MIRSIPPRLLVLLGCATVAADAQSSPAVASRDDRRVIFTAEQTLRRPPPIQCEDGVLPDVRRAWTPTEAQVDTFEARAEASRSRELAWYGQPEGRPYGLTRQFRQHFGTYCGDRRRIQMVELDSLSLEISERWRRPERPAGYMGPLWRELPLLFTDEITPRFAAFDPAGDTLLTDRRPYWEHQVRWPESRERRWAWPGSICIALGFGPWSRWGADWLPRGWDERFPHLELRDPGLFEETGRLRVAPNSPRPPIPTMAPFARNLRYALAFDWWKPGPGDSISIVRMIALSTGLSVEGVWTGDTLRAHAVTGSDNIMVDESGNAVWDGEAHAFAVRYPCDDPRAAEAAEQAMERLRADARPPLPSSRGGSASP